MENVFMGIALPLRFIESDGLKVREKREDVNGISGFKAVARTDGASVYFKWKMLKGNFKPTLTIKKQGRAPGRVQEYSPFYAGYCS
jgi:hypothetical protein